MQHDLIKKFYDLWTEKYIDSQFPSVTDFSEDELKSFQKQEFIINQIDGGFYFERFGARLQHVTEQDLNKDELFDIYPAILQNIMREQIRFTFKEAIGLNRVARYWIKQSHIDVEWILLPAYAADGSLRMIGVVASFAVDQDRNVLVSKSKEVERVIIQNYLSLGKKDLTLDRLSSEVKTYLSILWAKVAIDGVRQTIQSIDKKDSRRANKPTVLIASNLKPLIPFFKRLAVRYRLKIVETVTEAAEILSLDSVDVFIVNETLPDGSSGLELMEKVADILDETALVMLLDGFQNTHDDIMAFNGREVPMLVKPVGEFALRQVIEQSLKLINR